MDGVYNPNAGGDIEPRFSYADIGEHRVAERRSFLASTGEQSRHDVEVSGVKSVEVPDTWTQTNDSYLGGRGMISTFSPGGKSDLVLSVLDKGTKLNAAQANNFDEVLALADPNGRPKLLLPSQIKSISDALGKTAVGDNQYSNAAKPPAPSAPVFKIQSTQVITVAGKPVVEVEGQFVDQNGQRIKDFVGIFGKGDDGKVNQMFMQTSSKDEFIKGRKVYKHALESLEWK